MPYDRRKTGVEKIVQLDSLIEGYRLNHPFPVTIKVHPRAYEAIYNDGIVFLNAIGPDQDSAINNFKLKIIQLYEQYKGMEEEGKEIDDNFINEWGFLDGIVIKD
ncbi:hypothetical protein KY342_06440 [Candidatus Woesearchaeota archaeon]|nr:hypothetical protein [Candidatus Woesearchaeota archaeon]